MKTSSISMNLTDKQMADLMKGKGIKISPSQLNDGMQFNVPAKTARRLEKARMAGKGSRVMIYDMVHPEKLMQMMGGEGLGDLFRNILTGAAKMGVDALRQNAGKIAGTVVQGIANKAGASPVVSSALGNVASQAASAIAGKGRRKKGGSFVPAGYMAGRGDSFAPVGYM